MHGNSFKFTTRISISCCSSKRHRKYNLKKHWEIHIIRFRVRILISSHPLHHSPTQGKKSCKKNLNLSFRQQSYQTRVKGGHGAQVHYITLSGTIQGGRWPENQRKDRMKVNTLSPLFSDFLPLPLKIHFEVNFRLPFF